MFKTSVLRKVGPYGLAAGVQAASSFLVLPPLLATMGSDAYGRFALLEPLVVLLAQFVLLGTHQSLILRICQQKLDPKKTTLQLLRGIQIYSIPIVILAFVVVLYWSKKPVVAALFSLALYIESINLMLLTAVRACGEAWVYCAALIGKAALTILTVYAAWYSAGSKGGDELLGLAVMAASALLSVIVLARTISRWHSPDDRSHPPTGDMTRAVKYGFPLIMTGLCQSVLAVADRYVLAAFAPASAIAAYVVCAKYANAMNLVATPVNLWWPTARFQWQQASVEGRRFFRRVAKTVSLLYFCVAVFLIAVAPYLLPKLGPGVNADPLIAALLISAAFIMGVQVVLNVGLLSEGHTQKLFWIAALAAALHFAGCALGASVFGDRGIAATGLVSGAFFLWRVNVESQRVYPVRQPLVPISAAALALTVLSLCSGAPR